MNVGIPIYLQHSFFSNGIATCVLSLSEALTNFGHSVTWVAMADSKEWFEDCHNLKQRFPIVRGEDVTTPFDIFIDVDGYISTNKRRMFGVRYIIFIRRPVFLYQIESSIYPIRQNTPNYQACDAIWMWEYLGAQDAHLIEILSQRPVFRIPFTWSSLAVDEYGTRISSSWLETSKREYPWICHISNTNTTNSNNCTIPIVTASFAKKQNALPLDTVFIHNAQHLESMEYFKKNILDHTDIYGFNRSFIGRQRCSDWRSQPNSFLLSHIRFIEIKPYLLDCLWNGIPVVHNSPWLKRIDAGYFYKDNQIVEAVDTMKHMNEDFIKGCGFFATGALEALRSRLFNALSPLPHADTWKRAIHIVPSSVPFALTALTAVPTSTPTTSTPTTSTPTTSTPTTASTASSATTSTSTTASASSATATATTATATTATATTATASPSSSVVKPKTELVVGFSDMWQNANASYNFWTLLLTEALKASQHSIQTVRGISINSTNVYEQGPHLDLLFFAPFGETWRMVPSSVPKIHITGENTLPKGLDDPSVFLNLGFAATDDTNGILRFPLWIQYLDWFNADQTRLANPRTMPLTSIFGSRAFCTSERSKFCAFIVSNPNNPVRNLAFNTLHSYKPVDSAGRLFNNVGDAIFSECAGGGGGELTKLAFLRDYKFCFAYENSQNNGYVTEKLLAAKAAGCIPIYWGAPDVSQDVDESSFLNVTGCSAEEMVTRVRALESSPEELNRMASNPGIVGGIDGCRSKLATVAKRIFQRIFGSSVSALIPSVLGHTVSKKTILYTSFATLAYIPSIHIWLSSVLPRMITNPNIAVRIYLGQDISNERSFLEEQYPAVEFVSLPTLALRDFPDIWNPQHFAWKLWIYNTLAHESALCGTVVWYTDIASLHIRWPIDYYEITRKEHVVVLEDKTQKNDQWCHERFCEILQVRDEEKQNYQIWAGGIMFVSGSEKAKTLFHEAWTLAQNRDVIVGPKWSGRLADGRPFGHRHDQSILSILRLRHNIVSYPLELVYCDESARRTLQSGAAVYVHRGRPVENVPFAPGISDAHIVSLARRKDRLNNFINTHGSWTKNVSLCPAYDGRSLSLTPALARLFAPNDFLWKKSIAGCALSHLHLWTKLAAEPDSCDTYLILEDDVKFHPQWLNLWTEASTHIPADFDILYLGGVLPPNRAGFDMLVEPVNHLWNRIKRNNAFGQREPTRYFHFCTYAYIINRRGAKKLLHAIVNEQGYRTSADHMICNRGDTLNIYCSNPLLAGCFQDDDPMYQQSSFNNFNRVDSFDSDIWNNDERFSAEEIHKCLSRNPPLSITDALSDAENHVSEPIHAAENRQNDATHATQSTHASQSTHKTHTFYTVSPLTRDVVNLESTWLQTFFGESILHVTVLDTHTKVIKTESHPIFILQRPHIHACVEVLKRYESEQQPFSILHISDEFLKDPVDYYAFSMCKKIYRNYPRPLDRSVASKVLVLPLGYTNHLLLQPTKMELTRPLVWSFFATAWYGRQEIVNRLKTIEPYACTLFPDWNHPTQLSPAAYADTLYNSLFVPCIRGNNSETFRFYEALACGAIPIYVHGKDDVFFSFISAHLPILDIPSWDNAIDIMRGFLANPHTRIQYRNKLLDAWNTWKKELTETCAEFLH